MKSRNYVADTYSKIARKYSEVCFDVGPDQAQVDRFLSYLSKSDKILDIGSGPGNFTQYIYKHGYKIEGIDISKEMIEIAQEVCPDITFSNMDMQAMKFKNTEFDAIISAYSLIHIKSSRIVKTLKEFARILKKSGMLCLIVQQGEPDRIIDEPLLPGEKVFMNFFQMSQLRKSVEEAGFEIIEATKQTLVDETVLSDAVLYIIAKKK